MNLIFALFGILISLIIYYLADEMPRYTATKPLTHETHFPVIMVGSALFSAGVSVYLWNRFQFSFAVWGVYSLTLLITITDLKYRLVPNVLVYPAIIITLLMHVFSFVDLRPIVVGTVLAFTIFALTAWLRPGELGGGDIKLALLMGVMFGFPGVLWALLIGTGIGGIYALVMLARRHSPQRTFPYAPFLCMGTLIALLYNPLM